MLVGDASAFQQIRALSLWSYFVNKVQPPPVGRDDRMNVPTATMSSLTMLTTEQRREQAVVQIDYRTVQMLHVLVNNLLDVLLRTVLNELTRIDSSVLNAQSYSLVSRSENSYGADERNP